MFLKEEITPDIGLICDLSMYGMACLGVHSGHYENKDCLHSLRKSFHQMHVCRGKIGRTNSVSDFEGHTLKSY